MTRSIRTMIVLAVAIALASLATWGVYQAVKQVPTPDSQVQRTYLVVAAKALPVGSKLKQEDVKTVTWPADSLVPGAYSTVEQVVGRAVIDSFLQNEPITENRLASSEAGAGLPPTIPAGMRAISVKVNEVIGVAGFVVPGTHVDVLVTVQEQEQRDSMTRIVVSNVQVLTAGTRYDQEKAKAGEPIPSTVVTVAVTPHDAERIALASTEGKIMLALRNPLDSAPADTPGVRLTGLMVPPAAPPVAKPVKTPKVVAAAVPSPPLPQKAYTVEAIRAAKRSEEVVR